MDELFNIPGLLMRPFPNVLHHLASPKPAGKLPAGFFYELSILVTVLKFKFHIFFMNGIVEFLNICHAVQDIFQ